MNKTPWTHNKNKRIARYTKRLEQVDNYLDNLADQETPRFDTQAANYEMNTLRKIAEELGDIPKQTPEQQEDQTIDITIDGINTNNL